MLTVFNVGQGDSFLLHNQNCDFCDNTPLLIDCGPICANIFKKLNSAQKYHVLLTHSHDDHIGGFPDIAATKNIAALYIPYYLPEIIRIASFLNTKIQKKYTGIKWNQIPKKSVFLIGEGDELCGHLRVLNPPKQPKIFFESFSNTDNIQIDVALGILNNYGFDLPINDIINYQTPLEDTNTEYNVSAKTFVHLFFISLTTRLINELNFEITSREKNDLVKSHFKLTANQASVVFKYENGESWLFTGDADQTVFNRLIHAGINLEAKYLKIPHHGSRENLSEHILNNIKPQVAIISHKNQTFGKAADSHPHYEIIELLDKKRIRTYYTNHVIKNGKKIKQKTEGSVKTHPILFV